MVSETEKPVRLQESHIGQAAEALARAFLNDPDFAELVPEHRKRAGILPLLFRVMLCRGIRRGEVYATSSAMEGVSIWFPSGFYDMPFRALAGCGGLGLLFKVSWRLLWKMKQEEVFATRLHRRLAPFPHWYLAVLGVRPEFRGKGCASRVVKPVLDRLDALKLPAYVETSVNEYIDLYRHFGFKVLREAALPGSHGKMWVMLRDAAGEGR